MFEPFSNARVETGFELNFGMAAAHAVGFFHSDAAISGRAERGSGGVPVHHTGLTT